MRDLVAAMPPPMTAIPAAIPNVGPTPPRRPPSPPPPPPIPGKDHWPLAAPTSALNALSCAPAAANPGASWLLARMTISRGISPKPSANSVPPCVHLVQRLLARRVTTLSHPLGGQPDLDLFNA